jgi:hypothetical protein
MDPIMRCRVGDDDDAFAVWRDTIEGTKARAEKREHIVMKGKERSFMVYFLRI